MKKLSKLFTLAVPAVFAMACGGDIFGGTDMGSNTGNCPAGTTLFRVQNGLYNMVTPGGVSAIQDGCSLGLNETNLSSQRNVVNDLTAGTITVTSQDGSAILGTGPVACNAGTLSFGPSTLETGPCQYTSTRTSAFTLTADNTFTLAYQETRSNFKSVAGMSCTTVAPCNIAFTLKMSKPVQ